MSSRVSAGVVAVICVAVAFGASSATTAFADPATTTALAASSSANVIPTGPNDDPAIDVRAQEWYKRVSTSNVDAAQLSDGLKAAWSTDALAKLAGQLAALGEPTAFVFERRSPSRSGVVYTYRVVTPKGQYTYAIGIGWDSLLTSFSVESVAN